MTLKQTILGGALIAAAVVGVKGLRPSPAALTHTVRLAWTPGYQASNEVTEILSSPVSNGPNWTLRFRGHTNQCAFTTTNAVEFYRATNLWGN